MTVNENLIIDLSSEYSGDLLGEIIIFDYLEPFTKLLKELPFKTNYKKKVIRVSTKELQRRLKDLDLKDIEIICEGQRLSLYDKTSPLNQETLIKRSSEILENLKEYVSLDRILCLWGCVGTEGKIRVTDNISLSEIYQIHGKGEDRVQFVILNGPLGKIFSWQDVKEKYLDDFFMTIKTLHFLSSRESLDDCWQNFFKDDTCKRCLPCYYYRKTLGEKKEPITSFSLFECDLPYKIKCNIEVVKNDQAKEHQNG